MSRALNSLLALCLLALPGTAAASRLYWTQSSAGQVVRSELDGSSPATLVNLPGSPRDMAVAGGKIYWVDDALNAVRRAELDGTGVTDLVLTTGTPTSVAVDTVNARIYWTTEFPPRLERSTLDGANVETLLDTVIALPRGLALDVDGGHIYIANNGDTGTILVTDLDGVGPTAIVTDGLAYFEDLVYDPTTQTLAWLERLEGRLEIAAADGTDRTTLLTDLDAPHALAFDPSDARLYWTEGGAPRIRRAGLDGSSPETLGITPLVDPYGIAIGPDGPPPPEPNDPPVLSPIGTLSLPAGTTRTWFLPATDPDGDPLTFTATGLPSFATFTDLHDNRAALTLSPGASAQGNYPGAKVTVSDGSLTDFETFTIVVGPPNQAPVLAPIGSKTVAEGAVLVVPLSATDPDAGQIPALSVSGNPSFMTLSDNGDGTGSLQIAPGYTNAGVYPGIVVKATDGLLNDTESITVTVTDVNRPPTITGLSNRTVNEGTVTAIPVSASDPDGPAGLTLTPSGLPSFVTFTDHGGGSGTLTVSPGFADAGVYPGLTVTVSDGAAGAGTSFTLTVVNVNRGPSLAPIADPIVTEGDVVEIPVSATDPDGNAGLVMHASGLPAWATFADLGAGSGKLTLAPPVGSAGPHGPATVTVSDGDLIGQRSFTIHVKAQNSPPVIDPIADATVPAGTVVQIDVAAHDPDGDPITLTAESMPSFVDFEDGGDGHGFFTVAPDDADVGFHPGITVRASDGLAEDVETFAITVTGANHAPVLAFIGAQTVTAGDVREIAVSASDPDGNAGLVLTATGLPGWASFADLGDGAGTLTLSPGAGDLGTTPGVTVTVSDGALSDAETFAITVVTENLPPVLEPIGDVVVAAGATVEIPVTATDPNGPETLSLHATGFPPFVSFVDLGLGAGRFTVAPPSGTSGVFGPVNVVASDGELSDADSFTITVRAGNRPPILAGLDDLTVDEGDTVLVALVAIDPDLDPITLSGVDLPSFVTVIDNGAGTGSLIVEPGYEDAGLYDPIGARASDGLAADVKTFALTVRNVNRPPVLHAVDPLTVDEGTSGTFGVSADDPDGNDGLVLTTGPLPAFVTFTDLGEGEGRFDYAPGYEDAGTYPLSVTVSDGELSDSESVTLIVVNVDRPAVVEGPETLAVDEGDSLRAVWRAWDPDGNAVTIAPEPGLFPSFATFSGGGSADTAAAEIVFRPGHADAGAWPFSLRVTGGDVVQSLSVDLTVRNVNLPPVVDPVADITIDEGATAAITVTALDPDGEPGPLTLDAPTLPAFATFTDHGDGTATLELAPGYDDAGTYPAVVAANDGAASAQRNFSIIVNPVFRAPALEPVPDVALWEGEAQTLTVRATTPDGPPSSIALSASGLPAFAAFTDRGDGTGVLAVEPGYDAAPFDGTVTVTATAFGLSSSDTARIRIADLAPAFTIATQPGAFRMIAPSVVPDALDLGPLASRLGPRDPHVWRFGRWNPAAGAYDDAVDALNLGAGYWIVTRDAVTVSFPGTPWFESQFLLPLTGGPGDATAWNQAGNPLPYAFPVSAILVSDGDITAPLFDGAQTLVEPALWTWRDDRYVSLGAADALQPGDAFWVRKLAAGPVSLVFPRQAPTFPAPLPRVLPASEPAEAADALWSLRIDAEQAGRHGIPVELGAADVPVAGWNAMARALVPAAPGGAVELAVRHDDWGRLSGDYVRSFRADDETLAWDLTLRGSAGEPTTLTVTRSQAADEPGVFWSVEDGALQPLPLDGTIAFTPRAATTRLRVVVTASGETPETDPAPRPRLMTAEPNPFAGQVEFRLVASEAGPVEIRIHDAAGRLVRRLRADAAVPGELRLRWDGRTDSGTVAPAGVYLARATGVAGGATRIVRLR